jgi:uncharacterized protein
MTKLILIAVAVFVLLWLLRRALAGPRSRAGAAREHDAPPQAPGEAKGDLVSCAHCGVNLPKGEAYAARGAPPGTGGRHPGAGGRHYCSEEHWRAGPRDS